MGDDKHPVDLPEFYIGKYPVTNQQYAAFVQASKVRMPDHWKEGKIPAGKENHPVVYVSWDEVGGLLPMAEPGQRPRSSPAEPGRVGKGRPRRGWPHLPLGRRTAAQPRPMQLQRQRHRRHNTGGSLSQGASPYGVLDMAGNVWEWTADKNESRFALAEGRGMLTSNAENMRSAARG